jgi:hypothetical protein
MEGPVLRSTVQETLSRKIIGRVMMEDCYAGHMTVECAIRVGSEGWNDGMPLRKKQNRGSIAKAVFIPQVAVTTLGHRHLSYLPRLPGPPLHIHSFHS